MDYIYDMKQSDAKNIRHDEARNVLLKYKEGGIMYDDFSERFREKYAKEAQELMKRGEKQGFEMGKNFERVVIAKSLLQDGVPLDVIEKATCLDRKTIQSLM